eukprot:1149640-Pelagomonas_calceolata.AAC.3
MQKLVRFLQFSCAQLFCKCLLLRDAVSQKTSQHLIKFHGSANTRSKQSGDHSCSQVDFVMTKELKTKPPGKPPSSKLHPNVYKEQLAAIKAAEASFIKTCEDFTRGGDAAAEPSVEAYFSYRRIPGNKSFIATEGAIQAMKSLLGVKGADPLVRVTLMQLALMDCKVCLLSR